MLLKKYESMNVHKQKRNNEFARGKKFNRIEKYTSVIVGTAVLLLVSILYDLCKIYKCVQNMYISLRRKDECVCE